MTPFALPSLFDALCSRFKGNRSKQLDLPTGLHNSNANKPQQFGTLKESQAGMRGGFLHAREATYAYNTLTWAHTIP
jgi:hypothetical protein